MLISALSRENHVIQDISSAVLRCSVEGRFHTYSDSLPLEAPLNELSHAGAGFLSASGGNGKLTKPELPLPKGWENAQQERSNEHVN